MELAQDCAQRRALLDVYSVDAVRSKRSPVKSSDPEDVPTPCRFVS
jgi:hypothetical protein